MWLLGRTGHMSPVVSIAKEHRPRRRWFQIPQRQQRILPQPANDSEDIVPEPAKDMVPLARIHGQEVVPSHIRGQEAGLSKEAATAMHIDDDAVIDMGAEDLIEFLMPEPGEDDSALMLGALVVPIPGHVEQSHCNDLLNLSKEILFTLVPRADPPRRTEGAAQGQDVLLAHGDGATQRHDVMPRTNKRSNSAPRLRGPGRQHEVVLPNTPFARLQAWQQSRRAERRRATK